MPRRNLESAHYKPRPPEFEGDDNLYTLGMKIKYHVHAFCLDPDLYGPENEDQVDLAFTDLDWVQMTYEFIRGGEDPTDADRVAEDHLLGYDSETGFWHPVDPTITTRIALDRTMRYSDVVIKTSLQLTDED